MRSVAACATAALKSARGAWLASVLVIAGAMLLARWSPSPIRAVSAAANPPFDGGFALALYVGACGGLVVLGHTTWLFARTSHSIALVASLLLLLVSIAIPLLSCVIASGSTHFSSPHSLVLASTAIHAGALALLVHRLDARAGVAVPAFLALTWLLPSALAGTERWMGGIRSIVAVAPHLRPSVESSDTAGVTNFASAAATAGVLLIAVVVPYRSKR